LTKYRQDIKIMIFVSVFLCCQQTRWSAFSKTNPRMRRKWRSRFKMIVNGV